jgi:phosphate transport system permease protein
MATVLDKKGSDAPQGRPPSVLPTGAERERHRRWRGWKERTSRMLVGLGGTSVIIALGLIFFYLFLEVVPLLRPASMELEAEYAAPGGNAPPTLHLALDRHREVATRYTGDGRVIFHEPDGTGIRAEHVLPIPDDVRVTSLGTGEPRTRLVGYGLSDGTALLVRHDYDITYPDDIRLVSPKLEFPLGDAPVTVDMSGAALTSLAVQQDPTGGVAISALTADGRLLTARYAATVSFMTGEVQLQRTEVVMPAPAAPVRAMLLSMDLRDLITADDAGALTYYDLTTSPAVTQERRHVVEPGVAITALEFMLGTVSVIVGGSDGSVTQWLLARDEDNVRRLRRVRAFETHPAAITTIRPAHARKGFVTGDEAGNVALHFSTSSRTLLRQRVSDRPIVEAVEAPRGDALLVVDDAGRVRYLDVSNEHPQVSLSALAGRVWYEGRSEGEYIWQSSSATDEFEPKFSLVPLTVGTLKAAFYAMMFAIPLAIMGAIYTAYFMTPKMRGFVKPTIEIMEALPTVILGFLAGLWLSPFVENHLPAVFTVTIGLPLGVVAFAFAWHQLPVRLRVRIPDGWEAALLIPVILLIGWACVRSSPLIELWLFDGSMRQWFTDQGITYDQRNAMVVGIAMGFAVIPTIFSIAEDAIFSVPKHLTQGSLALGATRWQTMVRVVILTASPGLFAAVMIGLGRAVGETMIVLMATGNSPVVNFNIFEGMRTLSANIAVEMPETEVGGTHYRIIFLSALLLFVLTFMFNTVAELVRQRLRRKYSAV